MSSANSLVTDSRVSNKSDKERRAYNCVRYWRWAHAGVSMVTVVTCGAAFVCQSYVNAYFSPNCILNADWIFGKSQGRLEIQQSSSKWGSESTCSFTQYSFASATLAAFILGWFFLLFRPSEDVFYQRKATIASRLVLPGILVCLVFFVTCLVSAVMYQSGVSTWCHSITRKSSGGLNSCSDIRNYQIKGKLTVHFYPFISTAQALVWLGMLCWLIHLGLVVMRFFKHSDFPSYFYESLPPQLPRKPSEVRNFVTTLQGTTILHSNSVPAAERTGANSHSRRLSLESTQLGSGYSLPFSSATSDASSGFDSGRRTFSFPPSRNSDRRMNETYEDLCTPPGEKTPIKVTLIDYGSTAVIRESGQKTSQF